jgi:uncharacterized membrane protein YkoI
MTPNRCLPATALMLLLGGAVAWAPQAAASNGHHGRDNGARTVDDRAISLDEAVAQAERRHQARAVRAEEKRHGDRVEYRIRLLGDDGRVFEVRVDAATGRED